MKTVGLLLTLMALTYTECKLNYTIYDLTKAGELFLQYIQRYNKHYSSSEEFQHRFGIFLSNLIEINNVNSQHLMYEAGINQFTDMTSQEVTDCCTGFG